MLQFHFSFQKWKIKNKDIARNKSYAFQFITILFWLNIVIKYESNNSACGIRSCFIYLAIIT